MLHLLLILPLVVALSLLLIILILLRFYLLPQKSSLHNHSNLHAVITGGSSGIGLSIAQECYSMPNFSHITLIARNKSKLEEAKSKLLQLKNTSSTAKNIRLVSVDIQNYELLSNAVLDIPAPDVLFNVAGTTVAKPFEQTTPQDFMNLVQVNYLGSVNTTLAFLPKMRSSSSSSSQNNTSHDSNTPKTILYTSSMAGLTGVYGYTAYSGSKFALRGFAESLSMELHPYNICVQLAFPPDTDTPGYKLENVGKPKECSLISEDGGLWDANTIAKKMVKNALSRNKFQIYFGIDGWMLSTLNGGMSPCYSLVDALYQILLMGLLRFVSLFYLKKYNNIIWNCLQERLVLLGEKKCSTEEGDNCSRFTGKKSL